MIFFQQHIGHRRAPPRGPIKARCLASLFDDQMRNRLRSARVQRLWLLLWIPGIGKGARRNRPVLQGSRLLLHISELYFLHRVLRSVPLEVLSGEAIVR